MKKLIFSLVIAIVSSVNVFGQTIWFPKPNDTIYYSNTFTQQPGININGVNIYVRTVNENGNVETKLNYNLDIYMITITTNILNSKRTNKENYFNLEPNEYVYSGDTIFYKFNENEIYKFIFNGSIEVVEDSSVSVGNQIEVSNLTLYPNPVQDVLNIRFDTYENVDVVITDLNGRIVYNENVSELTSVDLSNQPSGIYFVNVGSTTRKVVKQ